MKVRLWFMPRVFRRKFSLKIRLEKYWSGDIIHVYWLGLPPLVIDKRKDWVADMMHGPAK